MAAPSKSGWARGDITAARYSGAFIFSEALQGHKMIRY
jgi:hypothetical protein